ncbi:cytochrome b N-terminal domain-containing protein [Curtobacterium flaccumfaciens pv. flaccumfaciens]|uniref:cytochrome bc1 complex cytochrome b subunit n=1 Tax=Curtobacterium flaccumfaciens TaxID=2035 RepID=UPI001BDF0793|nr:cytochrome b N-terminal domain-containing protein [Curtobacterium flaccumfaciens]MBT1669161.1 cytochrome b N-terminal domain-containing protein [Curtobacterium flaccumfaciens pv. flaccumfaciens]
MRTDRRAERRPARSASDRFAATALGQWTAGTLTRARARPVSLHWTSLMGVATTACAAVFVISGATLMFFFVPSSAPTQYHGAYLPLDGVTVSAAYASVLHVAFDVPGGMLLRQLHHWSMQLLPAVIMVQMLVVFFTGGFRKPRRTSWVLLFTLLVVALIAGWSGYGLPDDMLSGTGLRIVEGITVGIPVIGPWASSALFGGAFPGRIIEHLAIIHFFVAPALLVTVMAVRGILGWVQRPAQAPGLGRTESNLVGVPLFPTGMMRIGGLFAGVLAVLVFVSATVTVNPVWQYGPSDPSNATAGSQPDWYTGFLDGALRLVPPHWEFVWGGYTWTMSLLVPLAAVTVFLVGVLAYPFIEQWISGDDRHHNLLQRPRDTPARTGIGVASMTFFGALWGAGSADVAAHQLDFAFEHLILAGQFMVIVGPLAAYSVTQRVCLALQRKDREILLHGYETGRLVRLPDGETIEVHAAADPGTRWRILNAEHHTPILLRPRADGRITPTARLRAALSRLFFEDRLVPLPSTELQDLASSRTPETTELVHR